MNQPILSSLAKVSFTACSVMSSPIFKVICSRMRSVSTWLFPCTSTAVSLPSGLVWARAPGAATNTIAIRIATAMLQDFPARNEFIDLPPTCGPKTPHSKMTNNERRRTEALNVIAMIPQ